MGKIKGDQLHLSSVKKIMHILFRVLARKKLKSGGGLSLRSKHVCGVNTFFTPHQREFALERGLVNPFLTRSLLLPSATLKMSYLNRVQPPIHLDQIKAVICEWGYSFICQLKL